VPPAADKAGMLVVVAASGAAPLRGLLVSIEVMRCGNVKYWLCAFQHLPDYLTLYSNTLYLLECRQLVAPIPSRGSRARDRCCRGLVPAQVHDADALADHVRVKILRKDALHQRERTAVAA
jgi:hypothetical protein